jgi:glyceraldehyde 3-phosphate dehydrogenase
VGRKFFQEIVLNFGREVGSGLDTIAGLIEKDATYGLLHRFLYGNKAQRLIQIVDEKKGKPWSTAFPSRSSGRPATRRRSPGGSTARTSSWIARANSPIHRRSRRQEGALRGHLQGGARVVINSSAFKIKNKALGVRTTP